MANEKSPTLPSSTRSSGDDKQQQQQQHQRKHLLFWPIIWSFNATVRFCSDPSIILKPFLRFCSEPSIILKPFLCFCSEPSIILKPFLRPSHLTFITYLLLLAVTLSSLAVSIVSNVNLAWTTNPPPPSYFENDFYWHAKLPPCELTGYGTAYPFTQTFRCDKAGRREFIDRRGRKETVAERQHDMDAQLARFRRRQEEWEREEEYLRSSAVDSWYHKRESDLTCQITFSAVLAIIATYYATVVIFRLVKGRMPGSDPRVTFKSHFGYLAAEVLALTAMLLFILLCVFGHYTPAHILIAAASLQGLHMLVSVVRLDAAIPPLGLAREKGIRLPEDESEPV